MSEKPILFSGPMVRAILEGRKTQTRRIAFTLPCPFGDTYDDCRIETGDGYDGPGFYLCCDEYPEEGSVKLKCPYETGGKLWVRETWGRVSETKIAYRADAADDYQWGAGKPSQGSFKWKPSILMPRGLSRITLEITGVKLERLQEITPADVFDEGIKRGEDGSWLGPLDGVPDFPYAHAHEAFAGLWDSINKKRASWWSNPYVWAITFKRL